LTFIAGSATMVPPMTIDRRELLKGLTGVAASAAFGRLSSAPVVAAAIVPSAGLPRKQDFDLADGFTFLNAAYTHPIPRPATDAARGYLARRNKLAMPGPGSGGGAGQGFNARALFAELINAKPTEIAYVPNTSTGENLVVSALGLDRSTDFNVVTDWLHFDGALVHLLELKRAGLDVRIVKPTADYRIDIDDLARVIDRKTKLVELSSTTMYNGFQHDLKAVCDLAHSHGAYVYADIIHTAGAEPFDVRASGVDFAACSSFKWLMADYGLGFLYARDDLLDRIRRPLIGYYQTATMTGHEPPFDNAGASEPVSWTLARDATGHFEAGSIGGALGAGLAASLAYIKELGVANIQAYRQPMMQKLRDEVPRRGFTCVTPRQSTASLITFARKGLGASDLPAKLARARVAVRMADHWMRVSPSIYNDMDDIDRLLEALA
jgi:selenocysteine lyase/cysteine desulfurase